MSQTHSLDLESGSSQYASIADASAVGLETPTTGLTIEAWVKGESFGSFPAIVTKNYASGTWSAPFVSYFVRINSGTSVEFGTSNGTTYNAQEVSFTFTTGVWYHIACTYDGSNKRIYINGRLVGTQAYTATIGYSTGDFQVGRTNDGTYWDGLIKDVRVFNDARTQTEIVADARTENVSDANLVGEWNFNNAYTDSSGNGNTLTASGSPVFSTDRPWVASTQIDGSTYLETNLVSYWTLDESSAGSSAVTRNDSHGTNHLTDNNTTASGTGKISNGADFEATNSEYLSIADASQTGLDITGDIALSVWLKPESQPSSNADVYFATKYNGTGNQRGYAFGYIDVAGTKKLRFIPSVDGTNANLLDLAQTLSDATWYHVVASYDASAGTVYFYVNGIAIGSVSGGATSIFNNTASFLIGALGAGTNNWDGLIDECAIYSRELHYGDVLDLYNAGSGITYISSTAYSMVAALGTFTLTGVAALFNKTLSIVASAGSYTLTGIAAAFSLGKGILAETGSFAFTGTATAFQVALTMAAAVGEYTLTGVNTTFTKGYNIVASVGSYVLTGISARFPRFWSNQSKSSTTWSNNSKSSTTWSNQSKTDI